MESGGADPLPEWGEGAVVQTVSLVGSGLGAEDTVPLRLLCPTDRDAALWQYRDGRWVPMEAVRNGSYLLLNMQGTQGIFCIQPRGGGMWMVLPALGVLALLTFAFIRIKRGKRRGSGGPQQGPQTKACGQLGRNGASPSDYGKTG